MATTAQLKEAREVWDILRDVCVDSDGCIDTEFDTKTGLVFEIGTENTEIWHWFEEYFNLSVHDDLMFCNN